MKQALLLLVALHFFAFTTSAQFPYSETFKGVSAQRLMISGSAKLTASVGTDPAGQGYLRLTENTSNNIGYAYGLDSFPSYHGINASFEFFIHKPDATATNQADGMTFFLFDASVNAFRAGSSGGALGYAQHYSTPGTAKGYIGIAIDEYGNFSNPVDGNKSGGPGRQRGTIAVRGPGNAATLADYVYQTGVVTADPAYNIPINGFTQRFPDATHPNYRKLQIIMTPGSSLGSSIGFTVKVIMYKGGATLTPVTLIDNLNYPFVAPAYLQFGLSASTGSVNTFHEVRNLNIEAAVTTALSAPTLQNDNGIVSCSGQQALIDILANDQSTNTGGSMNKTSIDLDPLTAGIQTSYTDAGKGTYSVNANAVIVFTPQTGFSGVSTIQYNAQDTYGLNATTNASIQVTVSNSTGPDLILADPAPLCSPAIVNITNPVYKLQTTPGSAFSYFSNLSDANSNTNNINLSANVISTPGVYYIRASLGGCVTIKPIEVNISQAPSVAYAGSDQSFCTSAGAQSSLLLATNPDVGSGAWTQVSGPTSASITYPASSSTPISQMAKGIYTFRWTVSNGGCTVSSDDVKVTVGVPSVAGSDQNIVNALSTTLAANSPAPGTGAWTQVSGLPVLFGNSTSANSTVTGLVPGTTYVFNWRVTNGTCVTNSQVTVTNTLNTIADAGLDRLLNTLTPFTLSANIPGVLNTGVWTVISSPAGSVVNIASPNSASSTVTVDRLGSYTLRWTITNGIFSNSDDVTFNILSVLPLQFSMVRGQWVNGAAVISWRTSNEVSNDHFEVERSTDGFDFIKVGSVEIKSAPGNTNDYQYSDASVSGLSNENFFYRVKQVDVDGKYSFSPLVKLSKQKTSAVQAWPNPFTDKITVQLKSDRGTRIRLRLMNASGVIIRETNHVVAAGSGSVVLRGLTGLNKGLYFLQVSSDSGTDMLQLEHL